MKKILIAVVIAFCSLASVSAENVSCDLTLEKNRISLSEETILKVTFYNVKNIPPLELPRIDNFDVVYLGPISTTSVIKGSISSSMSYAYSLKPSKAGNFTIGPLNFSFGGMDFATNSVNIEVLGGAVPVPDEADSVDMGSLIGDRAVVRLIPDKKEVYLYEVFSLSVKLLLNGLYAQDVEYPQVHSDVLTIGDFKSLEKSKETINGVVYDVAEFKTSAFALKPGTVKIGPAVIKCNILAVRRPDTGKGDVPFVLKDSFFEDSVNDYIKYPLSLESAPVVLMILPFPEENKPSGFTGAVGDFKLKLSVSGNKFSAHSPINARIEVGGKGNFNSVRCPAISSADGFKVYDPINKGGTGVRIFEQAIVPLSSSVKKLPVFTMSYFDPQKKKYVTLSEGGGEVFIRDADDKQYKKEAGVKEDKESVLYIKPQLSELFPAGGKEFPLSRFLVLLFIPLLAVPVVKLYAMRFMKLKFDVRYARFSSAAVKAVKGLKRSKALISAKTQGDFYESVYKTMREYIADKNGIPSAGVTLHEIRAVFSGGRIPESIFKEIEEIFVECDHARYSLSSMTEDKMRLLLLKANKTLRNMEKSFVFKKGKGQT